MNAITERWIGGCRRELLDRALAWNQAHLRRVLREYEIHHNQRRPHRSLHGAAPLKPLPGPMNLDHYRVRKQTRVSAVPVALPWPDQRIPPGRMTWTRLSARTGSIEGAHGQQSGRRAKTTRPCDGAARRRRGGVLRRANLGPTERDGLLVRAK